LRVVQLVSPFLQKRERLRRPNPHLKWAGGTKLENTKPPHTIFFSVTEKPYTHQESNNSKNPTLTALKPKEDHQQKKKKKNIQREMQESQERAEYTLVARKPSFGLPTGCPICLPVYIHLKFASFPFRLDFNNTFPDSGILFWPLNFIHFILMFLISCTGFLLVFSYYWLTFWPFSCFYFVEVCFLCVNRTTKIKKPHFFSQVLFHRMNVDLIMFKMATGHFSVTGSVIVFKIDAFISLRNFRNLKVGILLLNGYDGVME